MNLTSLTQATAQVIETASSQLAVSAEALGEYTSIVQSGAGTDDKAVRSTEIGVREMGERQQTKAKEKFQDWVQTQLNKGAAAFEKLFGNLFFMAGLDTPGQRNQSQLAHAIKELHQALGSLSRTASTGFQVEDSHNVLVRRAKAHYFKAGSGIYLDGGPTVVMTAVAAVLRAHGFNVEADIVGVIGDTEVHRLANAYTLDARKLAMYLRQSAMVSAPEIKLISGDLMGSASIRLDGDNIELATGVSSLKLTPEGIVLTGPILQLIGVLQTPALNPVTASPIAVPLTPIGGVSMDPTALENVKTQLSGITSTAMQVTSSMTDSIQSLLGDSLPIIDSMSPNQLALSIPPVDATHTPKPQTAMPQWKGHLPQPWV